MLVTLSGIVKVTKLEQPWKVPDPILVILFGNVMLVKPVPAKAELPILVTPFGIVMLVKLLA